MTRVSTAVLALLCATIAHTARAIPSQPAAHTPSAVDGDRFDDLDTRDEHQWGSSFNHTEWGLTEEDVNFFEEEELDADNSTALFDDEHELDARSKTVKKVGLAFNWLSPVNPGAWKNSNIRACVLICSHAGLMFYSPISFSVYNWDIWKPTNMPKGVPYWPMLHRQELTKDWLTVCKKGYAKVALGLNEPDHQNQANMSPKQAAAIWRKYMLPLKKRGYTLISPAVTSAPSGLKWLKAWKKECPSCWKSIDGGVALHYYGKSATGFKNYMVGLPLIGGELGYSHTRRTRRTRSSASRSTLPRRLARYCYFLPLWISFVDEILQDFTGNKCSAKQAAAYMNAVTSWSMSALTSIAMKSMGSSNTTRRDLLGSVDLLLRDVAQRQDAWRGWRRQLSRRRLGTPYRSREEVHQLLDGGEYEMQTRRVFSWCNFLVLLN